MSQQIPGKYAQFINGIYDNPATVVSHAFQTNDSELQQFIIAYCTGTGIDLDMKWALGGAAIVGNLQLMKKVITWCRDDRHMSEEDISRIVTLTALDTVYHKQLPALKYLYSQGSQRSYTNMHLYAACYIGDVDIIFFLYYDSLQQGTELDYNFGLRGACFGGQEKAMMIMLAFGATELNPPLSDACYNRHQRLVAILINLGADSCTCMKSLDEHLVGSHLLDSSFNFREFQQEILRQNSDLADCEIFE